MIKQGTYTYHAYILWGADPVRAYEEYMGFDEEDRDEDQAYEWKDYVEIYTFDTQAELNAFLKGFSVTLGQDDVSRLLECGKGFHAMDEGTEDGE